MGRGSRFSSVLNFFREAEVDEVRAIMPLVLEAVGKRHILISGPAVVRAQRKPRATKAEMAARRLNGADRDHGAGSPISEDLR